MTKAANVRIATSIVLLTATHLAALVLMFWLEAGVVPKAVFLVAWAFLNFFWITLLRRAAPAGLLSLAMIALIILLSTFRFKTLNMPATVFEAVVVDRETYSFLLETFPALGWQLTMIVLGAVTAAALISWLDPLRIRTGRALLGCLLSFAILGGFPSPLPSFTKSSLLATIMYPSSRDRLRSRSWTS